MVKTPAILLCIALSFGVAGTVYGQPSTGSQNAPPLQGNPNDQRPHSKTPTDAQILAECVVREQADRTGMSKSEAEAACRERLATKGAHRKPADPARK